MSLVDDIICRVVFDFLTWRDIGAGIKQTCRRYMGLVDKVERARRIQFDLEFNRQGMSCISPMPTAADEWAIARCLDIYPFVVECLYLMVFVSKSRGTFHEYRDRVVSSAVYIVQSRDTAFQDFSVADFVILQIMVDVLQHHPGMDMVKINPIQLEMAIELLTIALECEPQNPITLFEIANCHDHLSHTDDARFYYHEALQCGYMCPVYACSRMLNCMCPSNAPAVVSLQNEIVRVINLYPSYWYIRVVYARLLLSISMHRECIVIFMDLLFSGDFNLTASDRSVCLTDISCIVDEPGEVWPLFVSCLMGDISNVNILRNMTTFAMRRFDMAYEFSCVIDGIIKEICDSPFSRHVPLDVAAMYYECRGRLYVSIGDTARGSSDFDRASTMTSDRSMYDYYRNLASAVCVRGEERVSP